MKESQFQRSLKRELKERFPGCVVCKLDPQQMQGIPDLLVLYEDKWAALECKQREGATHRPNQDIRVEQFNKMSYASFVYPENRKEVLDDLERLFKT